MSSTTRGSAIRAARIAAKRSVSEAAAHITRDPQAIRRYETGRAQAPEGVLLALARFYDVDPAKLVD